MTKNKNPKIYPYILIFGFFLVAIVNLFYILISQKTWRGTIQKDPYQKDIEYNKIIKQKNKQTNLGWKLKLNYNSKKNIIELSVFDKNGRIIKDAETEVIFKRPTQESLDFSVVLRFFNGEYIGNINFPAPGKWKAEIIIIKNDIIFQESKEFFIAK